MAAAALLAGASLRIAFSAISFFLFILLWAHSELTDMEQDGCFQGSFHPHDQARCMNRRRGLATISSLSDESHPMTNHEITTANEMIPRFSSDHDNAEKVSVLAGLDCSPYGGPSNDKAAEMVYWNDISSDNEHASPFLDTNKFVTFEPDPAGWNNARMSMETVLTMALAMGRTLVLPPRQGMNQMERGEHPQDNHLSFEDFYPLQEISAEYRGLNIISMEDFLTQQAMTGQLKDSSGRVHFPPGNRTDWNGGVKAYQDGPWKKFQDGSLTDYLRTVAYWPDWDPKDCLAAFPASQDETDLQTLMNLKERIETGGWDKKHMRWNAFEDYIGKPTPVNATVEERAQEMWAGRNTLCIYDADMQAALVIHFGDWKQDLWMKRFVRDHLRYVDEIQCAAARIVGAVRERALKHNPESNGSFDAFHVRRGDFSWKKVLVDSDKIYAMSKDDLTPNSTVYIATDERDRSFFEPLTHHYNILFLDDFKHLVKNLNANYLGMVDQLVSSRANTFFGCFWSSFSGHINRFRGYHSVKSRLLGFEDGALPSTFYYAEDRHKLVMHKYTPVKIPFWAREYPTVWRDLDRPDSMIQ